MLKKIRIGNISKGIEVVEGVPHLHFREVLIVVQESLLKDLKKYIDTRQDPPNQETGRGF